MQLALFIYSGIKNIHTFTNNALIDEAHLQDLCGMGLICMGREYIWSESKCFINALFNVPFWWGMIDWVANRLDLRPAADLLGGWPGSNLFAYA